MDLELSKIDWPQIGEEEIYDIFDNLEQPGDKFEMALYLMEHHPGLELSYFEMIDETIEELLFDNNYEKVEQLVNSYAKNLPAEYVTDHQYLEKYLLDYWPQLYAPDPSIERIYRDTYCKNNQRTEVYDNYQKLTFNFLRPDLQKEVKENNRLLFNDFTNKNYEIDEPRPDHKFYNSTEPYVKSEPDVGRNDPCPCGSGKKFKKCCLNN